MYPSPDQIGGGKAMLLLPSIIVDLKKEKLINNDTKEIYGTKVTASTLKNRQYPPFQTAKIEIDYRHGINEDAGMLDLAVDAGIVEQNGAWYSYKNERLGQGKEKATEGLVNFGEIFDEIDNFLKTTGYSKVDKEVEEAAKLLEEEENKGEEG
jgi:recombination protein RecA